MATVVERSWKRSIEVGDLNVATTLGVFGLYPGDPTHRRGHQAFAKATPTPDGDAAARLQWRGGTVDVEAWGPGGRHLLDLVPGWLGAGDDLSGFDPALDPRIEQMWRRFGNFRMARFGLVWQELLLIIIGQRVTSTEATKSWARLCRRWGRPAPGPDELWLPPTPDVLAGLHYTDLHEVNIERRRADVLTAAAKRANRLEEAAAMAPVDAAARLQALPGLGAWTATATVGITHGDPDMVMLGDYGMPTVVNHAFTGDARRLPPEPDGDRIMLEHLAPWMGHRARVVRLIMASDLKVPRRGPRAYNPDIRRM